MTEYMYNTIQDKDIKEDYKIAMKPFVGKSYIIYKDKFDKLQVKYQFKGQWKNVKNWNLKGYYKEKYLNILATR